jgi:hypothetical protein
VCHAEQRLSAPTIVCKSEQCVNSARTARAESEQAPEGAPDSEQCLSDAPPDCRVAPLVRAPMVEPQWLGDVAGAPDSVRCRTEQCPVPHRTVRCARRQTASPNDHFGGWGYKYPPTTTLQSIQVFSQPFYTRASAFNTRHN